MIVNAVRPTRIASAPNLCSPEFRRPVRWEPTPIAVARARSVRSGSDCVCSRRAFFRNRLPRPIARALGSGQIAQPAVDLSLGFIALNTVALLNPADELGTFALDQIEIVIGELAPLLLHFAFYLFPISFQAIPVHGSLLLELGPVREDSLPVVSTAQKSRT